MNHADATVDRPPVLDEFDSPAAPAPRAEPILDPHALVLGEVLADRIHTLAATSERSSQVAIGFSEVGGDCQRKLAHRLAGTAVSHRADPWPALVGTGVHTVLAEGFTRVDAGVGRFLVEHRVSYRGVVGTADLYDRRLRTVVDWKTTTKAKIARIRRMGPPASYSVQLQGYAAGLAEQGYDPAWVALAYLPTDGTVADMYIHLGPVDLGVIDAAVDRLDHIATTPLTETAMAPSPLCNWCPFYAPKTTDLSTGCPGQH